VGARWNDAPEVFTDLDAKIEYVNEAFLRITGYSKKEVIGQNPRILKSGALSPKFYEKMWLTILAGEVWQGEFHNKKKSGGYYWSHASIAPIKNSEGEIINFIGMEEDFTARKNAEDALIQAHKRVEELSQAKDIFIQNITHELKTPLSVILGNISLLRDIAPKESAKEWTRLLDMEERNAIRLRRSIEQILQLNLSADEKAALLKSAASVKELCGVLK